MKALPELSLERKQHCVALSKENNTNWLISVKPIIKHTKQHDEAIPREDITKKHTRMIQNTHIRPKHCFIQRRAVFAATRTTLSSASLVSLRTAEASAKHFAEASTKHSAEASKQPHMNTHHSSSPLQNMPQTTAAYIAGFLDADGSIFAQITPRPDYTLNYQIRVSISFFQKTTNHWHLMWLHKQCKYGILRKRKDNMSEYTIVGKDAVKKVLTTLQPWIRGKQAQVKLMLHIIQALPKAKDPQTFLTLCESVDRFAVLNFSKKRKITSDTVRSTFEQKAML
jgi:hypothetical protein